MTTCGRRMEVRREEMAIRKGPWMAEEDEVLMAYVQKYGPRDWSSIRSKGLLPRTGKSCRLRWVNKLKPDLKTGCKFSAEEERIVIELQARFGNKWARIATFLPGRTDNDVKNFWSTRQKRLARILQTSNHPKPNKNHDKAPLCQATCLTAASLDSIVVEQELDSRNHPCHPSYIENPEAIRMLPLPDLMQPSLLSLEHCLPQLEYTPPEKKPRIEPQAHFSFLQLPQPVLDLPPLLSESQDLVPGLGDTGNLMDMFAPQETSAPDHGSQYSVTLPLLGLKGNSRNSGKGDSEAPATPDSFFDDFPADMFDYTEPLASSSEW